MKNLLIYINPSRTFFGKEKSKSRDCTTLVKIQIDNSFDLGWKKEDILLVTNFDYEYNGVKSLVVDDNNFCPFDPLSTKTVTVSYLLSKGYLKNQELYWAHDFDAYQDNVITETELELSATDIGFTDYGWRPKWCLGSYFFKESSKDIFELIKNTAYKHKITDERALALLTSENTNNLNERIERLNITYNFGMRNVGFNYKIATKPLKVLHFHPHYTYKDNLPDTPLNCFMYGKNELNMPLMSERLIKIFHHHGIIQ